MNSQNTWLKVLAGGLIIIAIVAGGVFFLSNKKIAPPLPIQPNLPSSSNPISLPGFKYIWTGASGRQFTQDEFNKLSQNYNLVIIEKTHGDPQKNPSNPFQDWDDAARTLKSMNSNQKVFVNFLTKEIGKSFVNRFGSNFQDGWILRDVNGNKVTATHKGESKGFLVDLTNTDYRNFIENQVVARLNSAPYDGVMFDNFHRYDQGSDLKNHALTPGKIDQLNNAMTLLIQETKQKIGTNKLFFLNGFARGGRSGNEKQDRGLDKFNYADGLQDEFFCYAGDAKGDQFRSGQDLVEDAGIMADQSARGKFVLEAVKLEGFQLAPSELAHVERYCFGIFMMGYNPGKTLIQYRKYASQTAGPAIEENNSPEQNLAFGSPIGQFQQQGSIVQRAFSNAVVYVNTSRSQQSITFFDDYILYNGGSAGQTYHKGQTYAIPPEDAAYFLKAQ